MEYVTDATKSGWISGSGAYVSHFEKEFSKFVGSRYCVTVSSGTAALHVALAALELPEGSEVIILAATMIATANVVLYCRCKPAVADVDHNGVMTPEAVKRAITSRTKCVIVVRLYSYPCDVRGVMEGCAKRESA